MCESPRFDSKSQHQTNPRTTKCLRRRHPRRPRSYKPTTGTTGSLHDLVYDLALYLAVFTCTSDFTRIHIRPRSGVGMTTKTSLYSQITIVGIWFLISLLTSLINRLLLGQSVELSNLSTSLTSFCVTLTFRCGSSRLLACTDCLKYSRI